MTTRITNARISFRGLRGGAERATSLSRKALQQVADAQLASSAQLTVRVPHGASDEAITARVASALQRHLGRRGTER